MNQKLWTIKDILDWGVEYFEKKQIESPRLNIELLTCKVLNLNRLDLYMKFDKPLNKNELTELREYVKRRAANEPLQYIIGDVEFYNRIYKVNKSALIPRPETEKLIDQIVKENSNNKENIKTILDIGTGTGCIAISLDLEFPNSEVFAIDISDQALQLAQENADSLNSGVKFFNMNILEKIPKKKFDLIVTNPPYVSSIDYKGLENELKNYEPDIALTDNSDGLNFYRRYAEIFNSILNSKGIAYLEIGYNQEDEIIKLFNQKEFIINKFKDDQGIYRIIKLEKIN